ncbi:MAG: NAD(+)/NADH kinase [Deltaproteobacteria bacterium]|nr:NAD(+)/NADH kinase [Deltaproteobacteria bacterium]
MDIRRVGIIANSSKEKAPEYALRLAGWLSERKVEVLFEKEIAAKIDMPGVSGDDLASAVDMLVVFGGDGTLLMAARLAMGSDVPILGINMGGFGFMTVVNLDEMLGAMELVLDGEYSTSERMMLSVSVEGARHPALNDVVINRGNLSRMVNLETFVDGKYLSTFKADGLIISTPTGSTAYSLSSGGPIVLPELNSIIINPICPHTLTNRPLVLPPDSAIEVIVWTKEGKASVTLDGQDLFILKSGDRVGIQKSKNHINLVESPHRDYLEILRTKLGWGGLPG